MAFHGTRTFRLAWNVPRHEGLRRPTLQSHRLDPVVARGVLAAPITRRLAALDLSLSTRTDKGARVLLDTPIFRNLDRPDLVRRAAHTADSGAARPLLDRWVPRLSNGFQRHEKRAMGL